MKEAKKFITLAMALVMIISTVSSFGVGILAEPQEPEEQEYPSEPTGTENGDLVWMYFVGFLYDLAYPPATVYRWREGIRCWVPDLNDYAFYPERSYIQINLLETQTDDVEIELNTWIQVLARLMRMGTGDDDDDGATTELVMPGEDTITTIPSDYVIEDPLLDEMFDDIILMEENQPLENLPVENQQTVMGTLEYQEEEPLYGGDEGYLHGMWYDLWSTVPSDQDDSDVSGQKPPKTDATVIDTLTVDDIPLTSEKYRQYLYIDTSIDPQEYITEWFRLSHYRELLPGEEDIIVAGNGVADRNHDTIVIHTDGLEPGEYICAFNFDPMLCSQIKHIEIRVQFTYLGDDGDDDDSNERPTDPDHNNREEEQNDKPDENVEDEPNNLSRIIQAFQKKEITFFEAVMQLLSLFFKK